MTGLYCIAKNKWDAAKVFKISHDRMSSEMDIIPTEYPDYWKITHKPHKFKPKSPKWEGDI